MDDYTIEKFLLEAIHDYMQKKPGVVSSATSLFDADQSDSQAGILLTSDAGEIFNIRIDIEGV